MGDDDSRKRSIERAKTSGKVLVGMGLNLLLPTSGTLAVKLGDHIAGLIRDDRLARLDEFHRRVFEGEVTDEEVTERFRVMNEEADFRQLLASMLTDIEAEKTAIYSAAYIHLIEQGPSLGKHRSRNWMMAIAALRVGDFGFLQEVINGSGKHTVGDGTQRLLSAGALSIKSGFGVGLLVEPTVFGRELIDGLRPALEELGVIEADGS